MTFTLNETEEKRAKEFKELHNEKCRIKKKDPFEYYAPYKYILTPTSIGVGIEIMCPHCGKTKDITDIDSW